MSTEGNKKILYLVTGAAGFLGGTVCRQLVESFRVREWKSLKVI